MASPRPHACEVEVRFPTDLQAEQALQILQVDAEPTDRVTKSFRLERGPSDQPVCMIVWVSLLIAGIRGLPFSCLFSLRIFWCSRIESEELKMLRVAVSSFYDYLTVVLRTMQEFDTTMLSSPHSTIWRLKHNNFDLTFNLSTYCKYILTISLILKKFDKT